MVLKRNQLNKRLAELRKRIDATTPKGKQEDPKVTEFKRTYRKLQTKKNNPDSGGPNTLPEQDKHIVFKRDLPSAGTGKQYRYPERRGPDVKLEKAVNGQVRKVQRSSCFYCRNRADDFAEQVSGRFEKGFSVPNHLVPNATWKDFFDRDISFSDIKAHDILFMDIETTGLSNSPLFLIGVMCFDKELIIEQFFARDYAEEKAVLALFFKACKGKRLLVTFNGRTFDVPYIQARAAVNSVKGKIEMAHLDLLHTSRKKWRTKLPDCKLKTIEYAICKRERYGDIPGSEIPMAYHDYVHSGNAWQMTNVLEHNTLDLITLADIMTRLN